MTVVQLVNVRWWNASAAYALAAAQALRAHGHESIVVADRGSPSETKAREAGLRVVGLPRLDRLDAGGVLPGLVHLARFLRREAVHVLIAHRPESHVWAAAALGLAHRGTALIAARTDARPPNTGRASRYLFRERTDLILEPAAYARDRDLAGLRLASDAVRVLPFPVDTEHYSAGDRRAARLSLGLDPARPLVTIVARLSRVKGHTDLFDAFARVLRTTPAAQLLVAGEEDDVPRAALAVKARRLGIADSVIFRDRDADPRPLFAASNVGVIASIDSEAVCRVAEEWMASERAVVGTRVNAVAEAIVDGETGVLVPPKDPVAMGESIAALLQDAVRRERLARTARTHAIQTFGLAQFACALEDACHVACDRRRLRSLSNRRASSHAATDPQATKTV
jgi:glycosyltransferase involved in cell wall biosynthesis